MGSSFHEQQGSFKNLSNQFYSLESKFTVAIENQQNLTKHGITSASNSLADGQNDLREIAYDMLTQFHDGHIKLINMSDIIISLMTTKDDMYQYLDVQGKTIKAGW